MAGKVKTTAANHVRAWRQKFGLNQSALAKKLGVSNSSLSELESGTTQLSEKWLYRIADALGTRAGFLLLDPEDVDFELIQAATEVRPEDKPQVLQILQTFRRSNG